MNYLRLLNELWKAEGHLPVNKSLKETWEMEELEHGCDFEKLNTLAKGYLESVKNRKMRQHQAQQDLADYMGSMYDKVYLVTINYPDKFTGFQWMDPIMQTIKEKDWIKRIHWVHEYHTSTGNHPHTHMIMTCHKKFTPRRLAETIYAVKDIKKYCEALNFVQVEKDTSRTWLDRLDYIVGDKKEDKLILCEQDRQWRATNNIPELEPPSVNI